MTKENIFTLISYKKNDEFTSGWEKVSMTVWPRSLKFMTDMSNDQELLDGGNYRIEFEKTTFPIVNPSTGEEVKFDFEPNGAVLWCNPDDWFVTE